MSDVRNIGLFAHTGSGKTSLADAMLFCTKENSRLGKVDNNTSLLDTEPEEQRRKITLSTSVCSMEWNKLCLNLIDTPGESNFFTDAIFAMRAADSTIITVDGVDGMRIQSEKAMTQSEELGIPALFFINKLDKERSNFDKIVSEIKGNVAKLTPVQLPIGIEASFKGMIDLISMKAYTYKDDESGNFSESDIPEDIKIKAEEARNKMIESIAETDEKLTDKYLETGELTVEEVQQGLKKAILDNQVIPALCGSAVKNIGVKNLLDFIATYLPGPGFKKEAIGKDPASGEEKIIERSENAPFSCLIFKTTVDPFAGKLNLARIYSGRIDNSSTATNPDTQAQERFNTILELKGGKQKNISQAKAGDIIAFAKLKNTRTGDTLSNDKNSIKYDPPPVHQGMISFALKPKANGDEEKIMGGLSKLKEEDPALTLGRDTQTNAILISGMGQLHIEVTVEKLKRKYGVEVTMQTPTIPYKETIKAKSSAQGKYKKQSGGRGQYGDTWIELAPLPSGKGFVFVNKIVGGAIPRNYIPSVEKGIVEQMLKGAIAGFPVVDLQATLYDGSFHDVDSSDMAFKIAASMGFKKAMQSARPVLLEPVMSVEITVPDQNMGDIIGDLNSRRGKVLGMEQKGNYQVIKALVPMAELLKYSTDLNSITAGKGAFTMDFSTYEEVPAFLSEKIIAQHSQKTAEEKE